MNHATKILWISFIENFLTFKVLGRFECFARHALYIYIYLFSFDYEMWNSLSFVLCCIWTIVVVWISLQCMCDILCYRIFIYEFQKDQSSSVACIRIKSYRSFLRSPCFCHCFRCDNHYIFTTDFFLLVPYSFNEFVLDYFIIIIIIIISNTNSFHIIIFINMHKQHTLRQSCLWIYWSANVSNFKLDQSYWSD